eukprot:gb/GFBE01067580.1/.p1 GENE.gb/GFBE01067580.1/~~gb/GFBE01067580.1/.p1  ORF type:complete len:317 (+),score=61.90 gb/GFBE01067580.1/:1-951(+)
MAPVLAEFDTGHCGPILDAQLDAFGHCLATASADGHIRLWDVGKPEEPAFLSDLGGHAGAVQQVAWAPIETGAGSLLASAGADGQVLLWGRCQEPGRWRLVHEENLRSHGAVRALSWAPAEMGAAFACASADGSLSVALHQGAVRSGESDVEHRWQCQNFPAHKGQANAVSWASTASPNAAGSLTGARFASAGDDGVRVWRRDDAQGRWQEEEMEEGRDEGIVRDVAWKPWDGSCETLAFARGRQVAFMRCEKSRGHRWYVAQRVDLKEEVWKLQWTEIGSQLLVTCGGEEQRSVLLKQQLGGAWDQVELSDKQND